MGRSTTLRIFGVAVLVTTGFFALSLVLINRREEAGGAAAGHGVVGTNLLAEKTRELLGMELASLETNLNLFPRLTGEEPFIRTYSMPLNLDVLTFANPSEDPSAAKRVLWLLDNGTTASACDFERQTNGSYLVSWNTTFATYGPHTLQVCLIFGALGKYKVYGAKRTEYVTNLVRFDMDATGFGSQARIYGILHVPSAEYRIEIFDTNRFLLKTIVGHTDNGVIDEVWNLEAITGQIREDDTFDADVYIWPVVAVSNSVASPVTNSVAIPYPYWLARVGNAGAGRHR
jgi:hypothetical protein